MSVRASQRHGAKLLHYTLGIPGFWHYAECDGADAWHGALIRALRVEGQTPVDMVDDASKRS